MDPLLPASLYHASPLTQDLWLVANRNDSSALLRAARAIFPAPAVEPHAWSDHRLTSFLREGPHGELTSWFGPGASAKTADAALIAFVYWLAAPDRTTVTCCSTTAKMLDQRIWGRIKALYHAFKTNPDFADFPVKLYEGDTRQIVFSGESAKGRNPNAMIRGVAIEQGSVDDAINNVIGVHNERMLLIVDEAQGSREALIEARINLRKGTKDFRLLLIGNPTSRNDPLGRYSEPDHEKGYESITTIRRPFACSDGQTLMVPSPSVAEWDSRERKNGARGHVFCYNGFDAPTLASEAEEERLHFLIKRRDIETDLREYGVDHPRIWTFTIGFIPPFMASGALFSEHSFATKCDETEPVWLQAPVNVLSIDPAFARGGDGFVVTRGALGLDRHRKLRLHIYPHLKLTLDAPPPGMLLEELACKRIAEVAQRHHVLPEHVAFDATGNQTVYVGLLNRALQAADGTLLAFTGVAKPSLSALCVGGKPAEAEVGNARAEAYFLAWHFLERGQLSGISDTAQAQFCVVHVLNPDTASRGTRARVLLENKREVMKKLNGKSPDEADTVANLCYLVRHRLGVTPGSDVMPEVSGTLENLVDKLGIKPVPRPTYRR